MCVYMCSVCVFFFDMFAQEEEKGFELETSTSLGVVLAD